jgi:Caspase domain
LQRRAVLLSGNGPPGPRGERLRFAHTDAARMEDALTSDRCGFTICRRVFPEEDAFRARRVVFREAEACEVGDTFLLFFAGHGVVSGGTLYLLLDSTDERLLSTALPADDLMRAMGNCKATTRVLVLDCCYAGTLARQHGLRAGRQDARELGLKSETFDVLLGSDHLETTRESDRLGGGFTTTALWEALTFRFEEADANADGAISIEEAINWLQIRSQEHNRMYPDDLVPVPRRMGYGRGSGYITLPPSGPEPKVQMRAIVGHNDRDTRLRIMMESEELDIYLDEMTTAFSFRYEFVGEYLSRLRESQGDVERSARALCAVGAEISRALMPRPIYDAIKDNIGAITSVELFCDVPDIPWELVYFVEPGIFLAELGLVRWVQSASRPPVDLRVRDDLTRFVIAIEPETEALSLLAEQVAHFEPRVGIEPASRSEAFELLEKPFDLLHLIRYDSPENWYGHYLDRHLSNSRTLRHPDGTRPIVFVNNVGWKSSSLAGLIRHGAGLLVENLWSVGKLGEEVFARTFYEVLKGGATVGQATRRARKVAKAANEMSWIAYAVYGHPRARIRSPTPRN